VHDVAFLIILGSRQTKRELCKMDLKNWSIRFPVIKAVFCKKKLGGNQPSNLSYMVKEARANVK
jgi:hypothetical protein